MAATHPHPPPALLQSLGPERLEDFYRDHRRLVRGILASFGYGPELDDLTQQVFATATTLVRSGAVVLRGQPSGLRAWLAAIADRHGREERRRRRGMPREAIADDFAESAWPSASTRSSTRTLSHARQVWERLPEPLQTPWILRHPERMTVDEIARATEVLAATVKRRLTQADAQFQADGRARPRAGRLLPRWRRRMSERRSHGRSLADLHEDALREPDVEATLGVERFMAWFDGQGAPGVDVADLPSDGRPRVVRAVEAGRGAWAKGPDLPTRARSLLPFVVPVVLAAAAALASVAQAPCRKPGSRGESPSVSHQSPRRRRPPTIHAARRSAPSETRRWSTTSEDGNELVALLEARNGYWVSLSDTDPDGAEPVLLPSMRPDPSPDNRYALHVAGPRRRTWGASIQVELGPSCYDASAYSGFAFDARGPGRLYAGVRTVDAVPVARGGTCTEDCYRSHLGAVTLESGWKTYTLSWSDLHQEGAPAAPDPRRANGIEFFLRPEDTPYDVWIDDVRFVRDSRRTGPRREPFGARQPGQRLVFWCSPWRPAALAMCPIQRRLAPLHYRRTSTSRRRRVTPSASSSPTRGKLVGAMSGFV